MASRYFCSCHFRLHPEFKVTILNNLVSRSKRAFEDLQEAEQALQPDVKKQQCSSPSSLASGIPSSPSNGLEGSHVFLWNLTGTCDDSDTLLELSDGESTDSLCSITPEEADKLLADDLETESSNAPLEFPVEEEDSGFDASSFQGSPLHSIPTDLDGSPEPLPPTGLSVHPSNSLPHSSSPANPVRGSNVSICSLNQTGLPLSSDRLQGAVPIETGGFSLNKGNSGSGIRDKEANQMGRGGSPVVSHLMAEHEFASVMTDRPSERQACVEQSEEGGESTSNPSCEIQGESDFASNVATEQSLTAQNEDRVEDHSLEDTSAEKPEHTSPDDSRRHLILIPERLLQSCTERYIEDVRAHIQHAEHLVGPVNELTALMMKVASEYHSQEFGYKHPTDLTTRNHAQRANRGIQKRSLEQWVNENRRNFRRFAHIPDKFERSPIPSC